MLGLLYSIADAGRELLRRGPGESGPGKAILPLCHALMGSRGEEAALIAACREQLAAYKSPKRVVFVDALPRNTMGKVQKNRLRESYAELFAG
jgi:malonyl-CoA/methylmalonyl-CoA synthetase